MSQRSHKQLPLHSLPSQENILRQEFSNGMVVLARSNPNSGSLIVSGNLLAGGLLDPEDKLGLADFTAAGLMRGTQRRSFQEIYDTLESLGASLGFSAGTHLLSFSGKALVEDLDTLLTLLAEALRYPAFPGEQI
ncbi:MAG: insulinase family protein, partial [Anaerolineae bacterium]|nr:insulinase family protein [Anaerolineae bacterium]